MDPPIEKEIPFLRSCGKETNLGAANAQRGRKKRGNLAQRLILFGSFSVQLATFKSREISHKQPIFLQDCPHWSPCPPGHPWLSSGVLVWLLPNTPPGLTPRGVPSLPVRAADQLPDTALHCSRKHDAFHHRSGASGNWGQEFCPEDLHSQRNLMRQRGTLALTAPPATTRRSGSQGSPDTTRSLPRCK